MYFNDINVLNIDTSAWLQTFGPAIEKSLRTSLSAGAIAGISVACVALSLILVFLIWKFQGYIRWFAKRVHRDIWKPR
jgi:Na+/H+-translocating membrane pyrophosphatase